MKQQEVENLRGVTRQLEAEKVDFQQRIVVDSHSAPAENDNNNEAMFSCVDDEDSLPAQSRIQPGRVVASAVKPLESLQLKNGGERSTSRCTTANTRVNCSSRK